MRGLKRAVRLTMKMHLVWGILITFSLLSPGPSLSDPQVPVPQMVIKESDHDFGKIMEGRDVEHTFQFFNQGDGTLHIDKVSVG